MKYNNIPAEYKPITMWGYFGWSLLFSIPVAGFVVLCVFALGGTSNINLKNYARSYFCRIIIAVVIILIIAAISLATGAFGALSEALRSVFVK